MNERTKLKRGISLIVLVITIIVIVILAVAVILSIANNNPIEQAKKAKFQNNLKTMEEELNMYVASQVSDPSSNFDMDNLNEKNEEIKSVIKSATSEWINKIQIEKGKLVFIGQDEQEIEWANEVLSTKLKKEEKEQSNITLTDCANLSIKQMKIYGNSEETENGIKSVGELVTDENDEHYNMYKIPIKLSHNLFNYVGPYVFAGEVIKRLSNGSIIQGYESTQTSIGSESSSNGWYMPGRISTQAGVKLYYGQTVTVSADVTILEFNENCNKYFGLFLISKERNKSGQNAAASYLYYHRNFKNENKTYRIINTFTINNKAHDCFTFFPTFTLNSSKLQIENIQIEYGNVATEYEDYYEPKECYIYLKEPLRKVEDKADYIDLANKKVYRCVKEENGNLSLLNNVEVEEIEIPEIVLNQGVNNVMVNTSLSPSKIEIMYNSTK